MLKLDLKYSLVFLSPYEVDTSSADDAYDPDDGVGPNSDYEQSDSEARMS